MSFFDWLLGKVWDKPQAKEAPAPKSQSRAELARYLEPGLIALFGPEPGKTIYCPHCKASTNVHHFSWPALVCSSCSKKSKKYEWLLVFNSK
jgi:hypothetical protein